MKSIWKFNVGKDFELKLPAGAKFLSVQMQNDYPQMWFEVNILAELYPRWFRVIGTGHKFDDGEYLGTFQQGPFVWHLYETPPAGKFTNKEEK